METKKSRCVTSIQTNDMTCILWDVCWEGLPGQEWSRPIVIATDLTSAEARIWARDGTSGATTAKLQAQFVRSTCSAIQGIISWRTGTCRPVAAQTVNVVRVWVAIVACVGDPWTICAWTGCHILVSHHVCGQKSGYDYSDDEIAYHDDQNSDDEEFLRQNLTFKNQILNVFVFGVLRALLNRMSRTEDRRQEDGLSCPAYIDLQKHEYWLKMEFLSWPMIFHTSHDVRLGFPGDCFITVLFLNANRCRRPNFGTPDL